MYTNIDVCLGDVKVPPLYVIFISAYFSNIHCTHIYIYIYIITYIAPCQFSLI